MASTYTVNTGIELITNGEQSGTWGDTTNTNLEIIDRLTNGVGTITLSGTTHTLTTSDGVLSDGQFAVLVFTGTPSGTNTVSIEPNTAQKLYFVRNSTAQTVILSQGSGATVSIAPSTSRVVFTNGGGVGAAVSDITNTLAMGSVAISGGTITGITDLAVADGGTGASTAPVALTNLGLTATAAEINILDGVTATAAEINILDGVTATAAELNKLDGATATTAQLNFVTGVTSAIQTQLGTKAPLASPALTGNPTAPTQTAGNNSTRLATTSFVTTADNLKANLASPAFTGTPTAPTAAAATNTTQIATTAMVRLAIPNVLNASGSAPLYACRAWVNFNGTGTVAIRASGNVSSITDNGTGDYTVNFATAMPDDNFCYTHVYSAEVNIQHAVGFFESRGAGSVRVKHYSAENSPNTTDKALVCIAIFR
jgi:hypothetical protein